MEKNKSIDGLEFRRDKKTTKKTSIDGIPAPKKKTAKSTTKPDAKKPAKKIKVAALEPVIEPTPSEEVFVEEVFEEPVIDKKAEKKAAKKEKKESHKQRKVTVDDFLAPVETFDFDSGSNSLTESEEPMKKHIDEDDIDPKVEKKLEKKARKAEKKAAKKEKKAGKKKSKVKTIIITVILAVIVLVLGAGCWLCIWGNDIIARITGGRGNIFDAIGSMFSDNYEPLDTDENGRTNILAFGTSGYNMKGSEIEGSNEEHDGAQLTDSIMAISIDQKTGDIVMISLPRDLKVRDRCTGTGKINEVYWCHNLDDKDEEAGAQALMDTASEVLGINFQYYAHVNWGSLVQIVDAIGGITVTLDETIEYDYVDSEGNHVEMIYEGVPTTINGHQALGISRARYQTRMGDFSRGNSQQKILIGIKDQIYAKNLGFDTLIGLFNTLGDNLRTNFSVSNIKTAIKLTYDFDLNSTRQVPLVDYDSGVYYFSTAMINNISYVIPSAGDGNFYAIRSRVKEQLSDSPIVREAARIKILNGSGVSGVARDAQVALEEEGYNIVEIGDAPEGEYSDITIYSLDERVTNTVQALKKYYGVQFEEYDLPDNIESEGIDIVIIIGTETKTEE